MTSCAYRCGIVDASGGKAEPSVYITDRNTDLPIVARLAPWLFADTIPMIKPRVIDGPDAFAIKINYLDGQRLFFAEAKTAPGGVFTSKVFPTLADYGSFIHNGVSSYTPSILATPWPRWTSSRRIRPTCRWTPRSTSAGSMAPGARPGWSSTVRCGPRAGPTNGPIGACARRSRTIRPRGHRRPGTTGRRNRRLFRRRAH